MNKPMDNGDRAVNWLLRLRELQAGPDGLDFDEALRIANAEDAALDEGRQE
jgi:hypothetical protein